MEPVLLGKREGDDPEDCDCYEPLDRGSRMSGKGSHQDKDRGHRGESTVATGHLLEYCEAFADSEDCRVCRIGEHEVKSLGDRHLRGRPSSLLVPDMDLNEADSLS